MGRQGKPYCFELNKESLIVEKYDVFVLPIIEWGHRFQRPQHIAKSFADDGHTVFYLGLNFNGWSSEIEVSEKINGLFEVSNLPGPLNHNRFLHPLPDKAVERLGQQLIGLTSSQNGKQCIILIQQPFWYGLAKYLKELTGWKIIYDCMDEHDGLTALNPQIVGDELKLGAEADLVVATSKKLYKKHEDHNQNCILIPNAADYYHFSKKSEVKPNEVTNTSSPIIGYYGAIMDWFDIDMILQVATSRPQWQFVMIGNVDLDLPPHYAELRNIKFLGEKPYLDLPKYLALFNVALIPFKLVPIIQATNPVKFYEYLSAGKPVVATALPELEPFRDLFYLARNSQEMIIQIEKALSEDGPEKIEKRKDWAQKQTWENRYLDLKNRINSTWGMASIIIVSYQNLEKIKECLESIFENTNYPNFEVIVVDNGSDSEVIKLLMEFESRNSNLKLILNKENFGFSKANNIGINSSQDSSEYIVLLNNDTVVTKNWLSRLLEHLKDPQVGMVGPLTWPSGAANEAAIPVDYQNMQEMHDFAKGIYVKHKDKSFEIPMLAMYCVALKKSVVDEVGLLDENFGIGMFEDDDYSQRVRNAGFKIRCAEDVFIHHVGSVSFKKIESEKYKSIFKKNREYYEAKWGIQWRPPSARKSYSKTISDKALDSQLSKNQGEMLIDPKISIILVSFNGKEFLSDCINSIKSLNYKSELIEILLIDNASKDGTVKFLRESCPEVKIVSNDTNLGFSKACNIGAEVATGEYLAFLNTDMRVDQEWLNELLRPFNMHHDIGVVGSTIYRWDGSSIEFCGRYEDVFCIAYQPMLHAMVEANNSEVYSIFASGGACLIKRDLFLANGGFDPRYFMYHEDVDLCWRLWIKGYKTYITDKSIVYHKGGASAAKVPKKEVISWAQKHMIWTAIKNFSSQSLDLHLPILIFHLIQRGKWFNVGEEALRDDIEEIQASISSILHSRSLVQAQRKLSDAQIFSYVGDPMAFVTRSPWVNDAAILLRARWGNPSDYLEQPEEFSNLLVNYMLDSFSLREEHQPIWERDSIWKCKLKELTTTSKSITEDIFSKIKNRIGNFFNVNNKNINYEYIEENSSFINHPKVSIIIPVFNNFEFTYACLDSVDKYSNYSNYEIIVVDNNSTDETSNWLKGWMEAEPKTRKLITNKSNLGFSAAINQGLQLASGDYFILLNNDTYVTYDWINNLLQKYLADSTIGIIGPVTNNIGNEAKIKIDYSSIDEMHLRASEYTAANKGKVFEIPTLAFFCVLFSRDIYSLVGGLSEEFGLGFFEDDDYCRRIERLGKRIICTEDVFIHHHLSASFNQLDEATRNKLMVANKDIYEKKWGKWIPHSYR